LHFLFLSEEDVGRAGIVGTGLSSRSFSRGFAGAWYSYSNVELQIVCGSINVKNKPNTSELSAILRGANTSASSKHDIKDLIANGKKTFCSF
jgi:hypothetical protein